MRDDIRLSHHPRLEAAIELAVRAGRAVLSRLSSLSSTLRARRELHELSDRMLKDIGVQRNEIDKLFR